jgi:predicted hydrolase (HD superfamily)
MLSKSEAIELVRNSSKFRHLLLTASMMKQLAERLGENETEWELVGLLHDLDIDDVRNDMRQHGVIAADRLRGKLPARCLHAIKSHDIRTGFAPTSKLDKALIAVDSMAVLVERCQGKPGAREVTTLKTELDCVSKKLPWHQTNILKARELGLDVDEFMRLCLNPLSEDAT